MILEPLSSIPHLPDLSGVGGLSSSDSATGTGAFPVHLKRPMNNSNAPVFIPADVLADYASVRVNHVSRVRRDILDSPFYAGTSSLIDRIGEDFAAHIERCVKRRIVLRDDKGRARVFPMRYKFGASYGRLVRSRILSLAQAESGNPATLLTLTFDPKRYHNDLSACWDDASKQLNRFLTRLRRKIPGMRYLSVIEAHSSGWAHYHIAVLGRSRILDYRELKKMWGLGHIWVGGHSGRAVRNPVYYVSKYVTKLFGDASPDKPQDARKYHATRALAWYHGVRSYSCSRGLIPPLLSPGNWDFVGLLVLPFFDSAIDVESFDILRQWGVTLDTPPPSSSLVIVSSTADN